MTDAKSIADKVAKRYQTRDPFEIAESLGFAVVYVPLVGIRGFYQQLKRNKFIYICDDLNEQDSIFVCAHELGHWFQHRKLNRIFMDTKTVFITSKLEREANHFAASLLFEDNFFNDFCEYSLEQLSAITGLSQPLVKWRIEQVKK